MRSAVCAVWLMVVVSLPLGAQTTVPAGQGGDQSSGAKKPAQKKASRPPKVTTSPGSGETHAERTARLRRECKGMPNAGACTGMTH
ncbi:MAG: hypothetical protein WCK08_16185 [Betaproteobacteria bacterium]